MDDLNSGRQESVSSPRLQRFYAVLVIGLATFLLLAFLLPAPIESYRAVAVIEQEADSEQRDVTDLRLFTTADAEAIAREFSATEWGATESGWRFEEAVSCEVERFTPYLARLTISTRSRHAEDALHLCQEIASRVVAAQPPSYVPHLETVRSQQNDVEQRLSLVKESRRALEEELASLERGHLSEFSSAMQQLVAAQAAAVSAAPSPSTEYVRLEAELSQLMATRRELARTRTDDHPQILDLDERLTEVRAQLARVATALPAAANNASVPQSAAGEQLAQLERMQENYRRQSQEALEAIAASRRREADLLSDRARLEVPPAPVVLTTTLTQPAMVAERMGGQPSLGRLALYLATAMLAGGVAALWFRWAASRERLNSTDDISQRLGLPVVSLVQREAVDPRRPASKRYLRRTVLAAEALLLLLALASAVAVLSQAELTSTVGADPFGTVAEAFDRTLSPAVKR